MNDPNPVDGQVEHKESPPADSQPIDRRWVFWVVICILVGSLGALAVDLFMKPALCSKAAAVTFGAIHCLPELPAPNEGWIDLLRRMSADESTAVHVLLTVVRSLLIVLFTVAALELLMLFLERVGMSGYSLRAMREKFLASKPDADDSGKSGGWGFTLVRNLVVHPQILVPLIAAVTVGSTVIHEVRELSATDDERIEKIESAVDSMRMDVSVMVNTLVRNLEDARPVPTASPELSALLGKLDELDAHTRAQSVLLLEQIATLNVRGQLAEMQGVLGYHTRLLEPLDKRLPPGDFRAALNSLTGRLGDVRIQMKAVQEQQEKQLTQIELNNSTLKFARGDIADLKVLGQRNVDIARSTRRAIGSFPTANGAAASSHTTIAGELSRLVEHDKKLARNLFRVFALRGLNRLLEQETDESFRCNDDLLACGPPTTASSAETPPDQLATLAPDHGTE